MISLKVGGGSHKPSFSELVSLGLTNSFGIILAALFVDGIEIPENTRMALLTVLGGAVVLGFLNTFLRPLFIRLTLPITLVTIGLFTLVINAFMLSVSAALIPGFEIMSFADAFLGAVVVGLTNFFLGAFIPGGPVEIKITKNGNTHGKS